MFKNKVKNLIYFAIVFVSVVFANNALAAGSDGVSYAFSSGGKDLNWREFTSNFYGDGLSFVLSIVGILAFLKGIYLLWIPGHSMRLWNKINDNKIIISISGIIITIISLYLIAKGFYF